MLFPGHHKKGGPDGLAANIEVNRCEPTFAVETEIPETAMLTENDRVLCGRIN